MKWRTVKLGSVTSKVGSGATPRGGEAVYKKSGIPLIRSMNVHFDGFHHDGLVYIDNDEASLLGHVEVQSGDVLFNITGASIGRVTTAPADMAGARVNQHVCIIRPTNELAPRFLSYFLRSPDQQALVGSNQIGGTRQAVTKAMLLKWDIHLPPLVEQERILGLLDQAVELRKLRAQADDCTAALIPALFHEMFGGTPATDLPMARLGDVAEVKSGAGFPLNRQGLLDQEIPFFKVGDMNTQGNESEMHVFQHSISEATRKELRATLMPAGSVIFPKVGAAIATNKKRILVRPSCVDNNVMAICPGDRILTKFILALLEAKNLTDFASNSTPPSIRKTTVEDWEFPLPALPLQKKFVALVSEIRGLEAEQAASHRRLDDLFKSMLHRAFNGEL